MADADVLVVEDDAQLRGVLAAALADAGFAVRSAPDGAAALALLEAAASAVVLLDVGMPILDGRAFLRRRQRSPELAEIPVLVLTAQADVADELAGLGADRVLRKPTGLDELLAAVCELIQARPALEAVTEPGPSLPASA